MIKNVPKASNQPCLGFRKDTKRSQARDNEGKTCVTSSDGRRSISLAKKTAAFGRRCQLPSSRTYTLDQVWMHRESTSGHEDTRIAEKLRRDEPSLRMVQPIIYNESMELLNKPHRRCSQETYKNLNFETIPSKSEKTTDTSSFVITDFIDAGMNKNLSKSKWIKSREKLDKAVGTHADNVLKKVKNIKTVNVSVQTESYYNPKKIKVKRTMRPRKLFKERRNINYAQRQYQTRGNIKTKSEKIVTDEQNITNNNIKNNGNELTKEKVQDVDKTIAKQPISMIHRLKQFFGIIKKNT